jgi:hypothetical protein
MIWLEVLATALLPLSLAVQQVLPSLSCGWWAQVLNVQWASAGGWGRHPRPAIGQLDEKVSGSAVYGYLIGKGAND